MAFLQQVIMVFWDGIRQTTKATGATNPRVSIVTMQVSYLPQGMQKIIDYLVAKAGGLADVSAPAIFKNFATRPHDFIRQDLHKVILDCDRIKAPSKEESLKCWF
jgi:hypothetical protein